MLKKLNKACKFYPCRKGIIILSHGSKLKKANASLDKIIKVIKQKTGLNIIAPAYLQFCQPDLTKSIARLIRQKCQTIIIIPFFLFNGNHVTRDIPHLIGKEKAKYPKVNFIYTKNLGQDLRIADIVVDIVEESIEILRFAQDDPFIQGKDSPRGQIIINPREIEAKSFQIVDKYLTNVKLPRFQKEVVKRVLHATSDLNYAKDLLFSRGAIPAGVKAMRKGRNIIVDAEMVKAGINKKILNCLGGRVVCLINNKDVIRKSSELKITRAMLAMRKSAKLIDQAIVAIGNAPTALFEVCDLVENNGLKPALIIGVPVGFVGAKEAKKKIRTLKIPYVTNRSRRGGSSVASAIINALLNLAKKGGEV